MRRDRLAGHDGAGRAQPFHDRRVTLRPSAAVDVSAMLGRIIRRVDDVFDRDWQAVQRPRRIARFSLVVGALGCGEGGGGVEMSEGPHVRFERFDADRDGRA